MIEAIIKEIKNRLVILVVGNKVAKKNKIQKVINYFELKLDYYWTGRTK